MAASDPPIPIPIFNNNEDEDLLDDDSDNDSSSSAAALHVTTPTPPPAPITAIKKPTAQIDESRKLFQRLWTDEDEIELLQGYLDYTTQRGGSHSSQHHHDTSAFYDQIRSKFQLDFNKNQLVEKLRRLKKKYRNVVNKFGSGKEYVFKSPHDQATFEISSRIWGNIVANGSGLRIPAAAVPIPMFEDVEGDPESPNPNDIDMNSKFPRPRKRSRVGTVKVEDKLQAEAVTPVGVVLAGSISGVIEETVKSCLSPIIKELLGNSVNSNGAVLSPMPLGFGSIGAEKMGDGRWRKQQILELEVFSKRLELMQDEVNAKLQELRSMGD